MLDSKNSSAKGNPLKGPESDDALVVPNHLDLPDFVHTKSERSDQRA